MSRHPRRAADASTPVRRRTGLLLVGFLTLVTASSVPSTSAGASAATASPVVAQAAPVSTGEPDAGFARALSADEVRARGLDKYVDMSRYRATAPTVADRVAAVPGRRDGVAPKAGVAPSGCWNHYFAEGFEHVLYGRTDVTWCGDGQWVTYTNAWCSGVDNGVPSYEYLGCQKAEDYGVGWNVYDVWTQWHLCIAWVPWPTQHCLSNQWPRETFSYGGNGGYWRLDA
jgi:hypothetical protein